MARIIWSIKDLVGVAKGRQDNEFDCNIIVTGARGNGKSSFAFLFNSRFKSFKPKKNIVYARKELMKLLEQSKRGNIMDDEAIRTGYKRNFYDSDQKLLVQMLNMYRDRFNIYVACLPSFYDLDRGLRDLFKIHIHIIERGLGVIHIANETSLYSEDKWDVKYNKKIEENWSKKKLNRLNFRPKYDKLTTFRGYIRIPKLSPKREAIYKEIKETKRKMMYDEEIAEEEKGNEGFHEKLIKRILDGKISAKTLHEIALATDIKYMTLRNTLNAKLRNMAIDKNLNQLLIKEKPSAISKAAKAYVGGA